MKILHVTDSHGTVKGPESRKDIYYVSFLLVYFADWSYIKDCSPRNNKRNNVEMNKYFLEA